jgi:methionyl-tRNA formyltransferase
MVKTLFFGTPALAVPYLDVLAQRTELQAVITTPDEPAGRGYEKQPTPVKQAAEKLKLPVLQPETLKDPLVVSRLQAYSPELVIVVAYGKILPSAVLKIPKLGYINVHFSLLPAYRGAAPIQRALMAGETQTGVSLFWLDEGMDTGPLFLQKRIAISADEDADSLRQKLVPLGVEALKEALDRIKEGNTPRIPQSGKAIMAPPLKKEEGKINWDKPAREIMNLIRGTTPWPGAFAFLGDEDKPSRLKVLKAQVLGVFPGVETLEFGAVAGVESGRGIVVKCGQEFLQLLQVQPEGKRAMSAWDFWQGARLKLGVKLR